MDWDDTFKELDREMKKLQRNMERTYNDIISRGGRRSSRLDFREPVVDVINKPKTVTVIAELPGIQKEEINLHCEPYEVEIKAKSKKKKEEKGEGYHRRERYSTSFQRILSLPEEVDPKQAKASFKNSILEVELPKKYPGKKRKGKSIKIE